MTIRVQVDPLRGRTVFQNAIKHETAKVEYSPGGKPRVEVDYASKCENPVNVIVWSDRSQDPVGLTNGLSGTTSMDVRCRKCGPCLNARAAHWAHRALVELRAAPRTWFLTLTLPVEVHTFFAFKWENNFAAIARDEGNLVTKAFKRMRKAGKTFRYLLVTEQHKSGYPHFHALIHEKSPIRQFTSRELNGTRANLRRGIQAEKPRFWPYIANATLVHDDNQNRAPWYLLKYTTKDIRCRIRASGAYGAKELKHS